MGTRFSATCSHAGRAAFGKGVRRRKRGKQVYTEIQGERERGRKRKNDYRERKKDVLKRNTEKCIG